MYLEIVSPENVLLESEIDNLSVPGVEGEFEMLNNHAPIVSVLEAGQVKIGGASINIKEQFENKFAKDADGKMVLVIKGGILEMKDNKAVVLAD